MSPERNNDENTTDWQSTALMTFILVCGVTAFALSASPSKSRSDLLAAQQALPLSSPYPDILPRAIDSQTCLSIDAQFQSQVEALTAIWPQQLHPWIPCILRSSQNYQLEPETIAAIILDRSSGNPDQVMWDGATGLMAVMPSDAPNVEAYQCINGPCFADRPTTQELLNPEYNIDQGSKIFLLFLSYYGDLTEALKHYGPEVYDQGAYDFANSVLELRSGLLAASH